MRNEASRSRGKLHVESTLAGTQFIKSVSCLRCRARGSTDSGGECPSRLIAHRKSRSAPVRGTGYISNKGFRIPRANSRVATRRDAPEMQSVEVTRRVARMPSFEVGGRAEGSGTLSPVKLRNIPREILQPARARKFGAPRVPHLARSDRATLRTTKIDDADFGGRILFRVFLSGA